MATSPPTAPPPNTPSFVTCKLTFPAGRLKSTPHNQNVWRRPCAKFNFHEHKTVSKEVLVNSEMASCPGLGLDRRAMVRLDSQTSCRHSVKRTKHMHYYKENWPLSDAVLGAPACWYFDLVVFSLPLLSGAAVTARCSFPEKITTTTKVKKY